MISGINGFWFNGNQCMYKGEQIPNPPRFSKRRINLATIEDKIYLNGWEYFPEKRKWKATLKSIWHNIF